MEGCADASSPDVQVAAPPSSRTPGFVARAGGGWVGPAPARGGKLLGAADTPQWRPRSWRVGSLKTWKKLGGGSWSRPLGSSGIRSCGNGRGCAHFLVVGIPAPTLSPSSGGL